MGVVKGLWWVWFVVEQGVMCDKTRGGAVCSLHL